MFGKWAEDALIRQVTFATATFSFRADPHGAGPDFAHLDQSAISLVASAAFALSIEQAFKRYPGRLATIPGDLSSKVQATCQMHVQRDFNGQPAAAVYSINVDFPAKLQPMVKSHLFTRDGCIWLNLPGRKDIIAAHAHYDRNEIDDSLTGSPCCLIQFRTDKPVSPEALVECLNASGGGQGFKLLWAGRATPCPADKPGFQVENLNFSVATRTLTSAAQRMHLPTSVDVPWATGPIPSGIIALVNGGQHLLPKKGSPGGFILRAVSDDFPDTQVNIRVHMTRVFNRVGPKAALPGAAVRNPSNAWGTVPGRVGAVPAASPAASPSTQPTALSTRVAAQSATPSTQAAAQSATLSPPPTAPQPAAQPAPQPASAPAASISTSPTPDAILAPCPPLIPAPFENPSMAASVTLLPTAASSAVAIPPSDAITPSGDQPIPMLTTDMAIDIREASPDAVIADNAAHARRARARGRNPSPDRQLRDGRTGRARSCSPLQRISGAGTRVLRQPDPANLIHPSASGHEVATDILDTRNALTAGATAGELP